MRIGLVSAGAVLVVLLGVGAFVILDDAATTSAGPSTPTTPAPTEAPKATPLVKGTVIDTRGHHISSCEVELRMYAGGSSVAVIASQTTSCTPDGTFQLTLPAGESLRRYTGDDGAGPVTFAVGVRSIDANLGNTRIPLIFTHQVTHDARGNFYFPPEPDGSYAFPLKMKFDFRTWQSTEIP